MDRRSPIQIGISCFELKREWSLASQSAKRMAEKFGVQATMLESTSVAHQLDVVNDMIERGVDGIVLSPIHSNPDFIPLFAKARAAHIPIVMLGSRLEGTGAIPVVRADHYGGQRQITEIVFERIGRTGKVAYLAGRPGLEAHILRKQAFYDVLASYPHVELAFTGEHDMRLSYPECGRRLAERLLAESPDIKAIVLSVDFMALGVIEVLQEHGFAGKIIVTGFDGALEALEAIHAGKLWATMGRNLFALMSQAIEVCHRAVVGGAVAAETITPVRLITAGDVSTAVFDLLNYLPAALDRLAEDNKIRLQLIDSLQREERFRSLVELSSDWYWEQNERFEFASIEGKSARYLESMIGKTLWELANSSLSDMQQTEQQKLMRQHQPFHDLEFEYIDTAGRCCLLSLSGLPIFDKQGSFKYYRGIGKDITEQRKAAERIHFLAYHDLLTSLPNRESFMQHLRRSIATARRYGRRFAVLVIDLDRFGLINEALGHGVGDRLLQEIGRRLKNCLRTSDIVARLVGDEFVALLEETDGPQEATIIAQKILAEIAEPIEIDRREHYITASVGIALYPTDGSDADELMKRADIAKNLSKEQGKNHYRFYSEAANKKWSERLALETQLRRAVQQNEFSVHYQPKVDIRTGKVNGMEALVRWIHPEWGMISPAEFVPLAEEIGLIVPIGKWVLRSVCRQIVEWQAQGIGFPVAVNLSPRQFFDERFVEDTQELIREINVDPSMLEFEITEGMMMHDTENAIAVLSALRATGVRLAVDDFGTGYSSLALLQRFPIDTLKVDRSFIKNLPNDKKCVALTNAIISMGKALDLKIIAEGVETTAQLAYLEERFCDEYQGFLFSRPIPAGEMGALLRRGMATRGIPAGR